MGLIYVCVAQLTITHHLKGINRMAAIETIARAGLYKRGLHKLLKSEPELDIQVDHVRIYWPSDRLKPAQNEFSYLMEPTDIRIDLMPVIKPYLVKKYGFLVITLFIAGVLAGGAISR